MSRLEAAAARVLALAEERRILLATAESCTGGMVAAALTDIAGSSAVFERGFVTYSNQAKADLLGVRQETLERFGAVSEQTAREMAAGALSRSAATLAVAVTGIAGPGGATPEKPVGLVWFGIAQTGAQPQAEKRLFPNDGRAGIRLSAAQTALDLLAAALMALP